MNKTGGQDKIKVINVIKNILDIQNMNSIEIDIKFEDNPSKNQFISIANKLQKVPFIYESVNKELSNTILLRNLLYNPALYPIITQKKSNDYIYTRSPIKKTVLNSKFDIKSVSPEEPLYVIGIAIDIKKQGNIIDNKKTYIVPEYLDTFKTHELFRIIYFNKNPTELLLSMIRQLRYAVRFYNMTSYSYYFKEALLHKSNLQVPRPDIVKIDSWYSKKEISYIKFLLGNYDWIYNLDPLQSLGNDIDQLLYIITEGPKSKHVKEYFILKEIEMNRHKELLRLEKESIKIINMARQYIIIIGKKLGSNVQQKVLLALSKGAYLRLPGGSMAIPNMSTNITNPYSILEQLTKDQQYIVKIEYDKQQQYMKAYYANKCIHLSIYKKLIKSKTVDNTKIALTAVAKYFKKDIVNGYYICTSCDFSIMCSHVYDRYQYTIDNVSLSVINTNLMSYAIKVKINKGHEYYCKFCGERLVRDLFIDDEYKIKPRTNMSETEQEIRGYSWSVIMTAIHSAGLGNEKAIAMYISNSIRPIIESKAYNKFDDNVKLICVMHTFAFILLLMKDHKISFLNIDCMIPASKIAEKLLGFIYSKYNTLMTSLNINADILKNEFMSAYKNIINTGPIDLPVSNSETDVANFILNIDPIYKYAKNICRLVKKLPFKIEPGSIRKEFETILGNSLISIIKSAKENMKNPIFADILNKRFGSTLQIDTLEFFYKHPSINLYDKLVSIDNENKILKKFLDGNYSYYVMASYVMFCIITKHVHNKIEYDDFRILFLEFKNVETAMLNELYKYSQKPIMTFNYKKNSHFVKKHINITELYDENGAKHKWNIYYYEYGIRRILIDVGCSVCGIKKSNISRLNIEKTTKAVKAMSDINSFYMFYKIRCPVNELHTWLNDICTKCKVSTAMFDQVNSNKITSDILEYYNQYLKQFKEKRNIQPEIELKPKKEVIKKNIDWTQNYTSIVKVSQVTGYSTNIIEAIGVTEGRTYKEIEDGLSIPEIELYHIYSAYAELIYIISKCKIKLETDYTTLFDNILYEKSYYDIHRFIIQSICEITLLTDIELFSTIIKNQKLLSVPIISLVVDESDDIIYLGDDIGDSGEDLIIDQKIEDNYFSVSNIDYEFKEDIESHINIPQEYIYSE